MTIPPAVEIDRSNSLTDLAHRIRAEHEAVGAALKDGLAHAMAAGDILIEAKAQLKHGDWLFSAAGPGDLRARGAALHPACPQP